MVELPLLKDTLASVRTWHVGQIPRKCTACSSLPGNILYIIGIKSPEARSRLCTYLSTIPSTTWYILTLPSRLAIIGRGNRIRFQRIRHARLHLDWIQRPTMSQKPRQKSRESIELERGSVSSFRNKKESLLMLERSQQLN
jgi:hypothetical protein